MLKRFHLDRKVDVSGVSGISNNIASGVLFEDGQVVIHWNTENASIGIYKNISDLLKIHGHCGATELIWDDLN